MAPKPRVPSVPHTYNTCGTLPLTALGGTSSAIRCRQCRHFARGWLTMEVFGRLGFTSVGAWEEPIELEVLLARGWKPSLVQ